MLLVYKHCTNGQFLKTAALGIHHTYNSVCNLVAKCIGTAVSRATNCDRCRTRPRNFIHLHCTKLSQLLHEDYSPIAVNRF